MTETQEKLMDKTLQAQFMGAMVLPQNEFDQFMRMNLHQVGEFYKPLDSGMSPAMTILEGGNIKNLNSLFEHAPEHPDTPFVAPFGEFAGHNLLDVANLKNESAVADVLKGMGYVSALGGDQPDAAALTLQDEAVSNDGSVSEQEYQDQIRAMEQAEVEDDLKPQYRNANAFDLLSHKIKETLSSAKVSAWKKGRPDATLYDAVAHTRALEGRLKTLYGEGPLANIMSDIKALNKTPVELAYAVKNDDLLVKKLDIPGRLASLNPETLQEMGDINRALQDNHSKWKSAMKTNTAHGRDISDIANKELSELSELSRLMPAKPKDKSKLEFLGEKVQMNLDALKEFMKNLGQIFSRVNTPKPA